MAKNTRGFKGIWIPKEIWLHQGLNIQEKVLYAEIVSLDKDGKGCWATNKYFGGFFDLSFVRISQLISSLSSKKLIIVHIDKSNGNRRRIKVATENNLIPSSKITDDPIKTTTIPDNNVHENKLDKYFEEFWNLYPRRVGKKSAKQKFYKIDPDAKLFQNIMEAMKKQIDIFRERNTELKYIPHPETWLNKARWEDEMQENQSTDTRVLENSLTTRYLDAEE